jgi:hypothetical protein
MKSVAVLLAIIALTLVTSCSSSGGPSSIITPVLAQSGYSNASIAGTYSISLTTPWGTGAGGGIGSSEDIGSFTADGAGKITAGTLTERSMYETCTSTFTGTYTLQSTATGIATLIVTSTLASGSGTCNAKGTIPFTINAGQSGASLLFHESDTTSTSVAMFSGIAVKQ